MKEKEQEQISLDDVIQAYMASSIDSSEDNLKEWIARYPQYEDDLKEFAAYWKLVRQMPSRQYTVEEEQTLIARAGSVVQNILYQQQESASADRVEALSGLIDEALKRNISLEEFSAATELSEPIILMLDRRQVRYESIPRKVVENIAAALRVLVGTVDSYLTGEMRLAPAHYRSDRAPKSTGLYDFSFLVRVDPDLTDQGKEHWLALAPPGTGNGREQGTA